MGRTRLSLVVRRKDEMSRKRFPASLPRRVYWSDRVGGCASCPDCGGALEAESHVYVMATRRKGDFDFHVVGNDAGHFCGRCPVVVLDRDEFGRFVAIATRGRDGVRYVVMGIVDLDALPEDKRSVPFDDEANPIPLVKFTNFGERKPPARPKKAHKPRTKGKRRKKRKRR